MSAWRQPLLWLVLALPLATVAAGLATWRLAAAAPDASMGAAVRRTAQTQVEDLAPDLAAAHAGLDATLGVDRARGTLTLTLPVGAVPERLWLRHPIDAARDRALAMTLQDGRWIARLDVPLAGSWRLELRGRDDAWRLDGRLTRDADHVRLVPRLAPPP